MATTGLARRFEETFFHIDVEKLIVQSMLNESKELFVLTFCSQENKDNFSEILNLENNL